MLLIRSSSRSYDSAKLFGRRRSLHAALGGGRAADVILWRDKNLSATVLAGTTMIWFLFEIVGCHFVTLVCHVCIIVMIVIFLWSKGATHFNRTPPKISDIMLSERTFEDVALAFHAKLLIFISIPYDAARGKNMKLFLMAIASLWISSVVGSFCSFTSFLYFGVICIQTLPALYKRYEREVDFLMGRGNRNVKKLYKKFNSDVLKMILKGPVKGRKFK
ncbi:reticulon-like protein B9 [Magnolia sinica]|uniref:reticulon-like protein B9 n=1 Tax=Magnolia sinica TaxID=86752 RepID=UPI00265A3F01|nr:reticulon-like protein B9 [Magnolia sinica]